MRHLTDQHIDYIVNDLSYRVIVVEGIHDEIVDHICSAVELKKVNDSLTHTMKF